MDRPEIMTIGLNLPLRMGVVNAYLVSTGAGFILIDTGSANGREELATALKEAGCEPGSLKLIILTHGDFDHTGNCAYLRDKFGAPVAMHHDDAGMLERGDMFWNRESGNAAFRVLAPILFRFPKAARLTPDLWLEDGQGLLKYGLDATVTHLPGHSKGSIGILTADGDLFCGDLLENTKGPALGSIMDDPAAANASVEKLKALKIGTAYPGHGQSFRLAEFLEGTTLARHGEE